MKVDEETFEKCKGQNMAIRYSGGLKINVLYRDRGDYRTVITETGHGASKRNKSVVFVRPAPAGFGPGIAYDSPQAYDEIASSALSFGAYSDERSKQGDWIQELAAYDEEGYWHIGRTPAQAWPR